jgi:membrane glycosyltransferase
VIALTDASSAPAVQIGPSTALFAIVLSMIFTPKIATCIDVLMRRPARRSYGGTALFLVNIASETAFSFLLSPIMAFAHTVFLFRLFLLRQGGTWSNQIRLSHAVPWRLAYAHLWPQTVVGLSILGVIAIKMPRDLGYALMGAGGLALSVPFAVATASPAIGALFARFGVGRIPEETAPPTVLAPLRLPVIEARASEIRERS